MVDVANDAVSAYILVNVSGSARLFELLETDCPAGWICMTIWKQSCCKNDGRKYEVGNVCTLEKPSSSPSVRVDDISMAEREEKSLASMSAKLAKKMELEDPTLFNLVISLGGKLPSSSKRRECQR